MLGRPIRDGVIGNTRHSGCRIWGSSPCPGVRLRPVNSRQVAFSTPLGPGFGPVLLTKSTRSEVLHKLVGWLQRSDPGRRPTPLSVGRLRFGGAGATTRPQRVVVRSKDSSTSSPTPTRRPCSSAWRRFAIEVCGPPAILTGISGRSGWTAIGSSTAFCSRRKAAVDRSYWHWTGSTRRRRRRPGLRSSSRRDVWLTGGGEGIRSASRAADARCISETCYSYLSKEIPS